MADKFVVATGTWDVSDTTIWSDTDGGAAGATAPTAADDVKMTAASGAVTVTIATGAVGKSITCTGFTGTITGTGTSTISGGVTLVAGMAAYTYTGTMTLNGTGTYTSGGKTSGPLTINGSGITVTLGDALAMASTQTLTLTQGTFNANGQTVTCGLFSSSNSNTRTLTMSTAQWTLTGNAGTIWDTGTSTNMTLNQPTLPIISNYSGATGTRTLTGPSSTSFDAPPINITAGTDTVTPGGGWRTIDFTGFAGTMGAISLNLYRGLVLSSGMTVATSGTGINTYVSAGVTGDVDTLGKTIDRPITMNNTGTGTTRLITNALTMGSTRSLTLNSGTFNANGFAVTCGLFSSSNSNTRTLTMGAGQWTLTGTNTTIWTTQTATNLTLNRGSLAINCTGVGVSSNTILSGSLNESSAPSFTVIAASGNVSFSITGSALNLDLSGLTAGGLTTTDSLTLYGNLTLNASMGMNSPGSSQIIFAATSGTQVITSNGRSLNRPIVVNGVGGTVQLADALVITSSTNPGKLTLTNGTFNANGMAVTLAQFASTNTNTRTLTMSTAQWTLTGNAGTVWDCSTMTNLTLNQPSLVPICNYSGSTGTRTIAHGITNGTENSSLSFNVTAGSDIVTVTASSKLRSLNFTGYTGAWTSTSFTIYGDLTLQASGSATTGTGILTFAATSGTKTITSNGRTYPGQMTFAGVGGAWQFADAPTISLDLNLTNGSLNGNGQNITAGNFNGSGASTRSFTMASGTLTLTRSGVTIWTTSTATNLTLSLANPVVCNYSGAAGARTFIPGSIPESQVPNFNVTAGSDSLSFSTGNYGTINLTGFTGSVAAGASINIYGNLVLSAVLTWTSTSNEWVFAATSGTKTITSNGNVLKRPVTFNGVGGTFQLVDALDLSDSSVRTLTLTNGTFNANGQAVTCSVFNSSNANVRTLTMGSGQWTLIGNNTTIWAMTTITNLTLTPSSLPVRCTYAGAVGTRTITMSTLTEAQAPSFDVTAGTDIFAIGSTSRMNSLNFTGFAGSVTPATMTLYGNLTLSTGITSIGSTTGVMTFAATSGTKTITSNGKSLDQPVTFDGVGGTWQLADAFVTGSTRTTTLTNGSLNTAGFGLSTGLFSSSNANIRSLTLGASTVTLTGTGATVWNLATTTNLTPSFASSTIDMSGAVATFAGGGLTYGEVHYSAGAGGVLTVTGDNTFGSTFTLDPVGLSLLFTAGSTQTFNAAPVWSGAGIGTENVIASSGAGAHDLISGFGGATIQNYLNITDSHASPIAPKTWYALDSIDNGGNTGWFFSLAGGGGFFMLFFP